MSSANNASKLDRNRTDSRLQIDSHPHTQDRVGLERDVREGLGKRPYRLPPKYFYDDVGSKLFDQICDTEEYYLTRSESALLERSAAEIMRESQPDTLVELGSGAARKTRLLIDAMIQLKGTAHYVPIEVNELMVQKSAERLLSLYPQLQIHGVVGDYERHLSTAPSKGRRLVVFLGSSIGNFAPGSAEKFLRKLGEQMAPNDALLIGFDLVKDVGVLERAYNDAAGITAAFNRNVLLVLNRELHGEFDPRKFDHVAFFNAEAAQIEMHLRAREDHSVRIRDLNMTVPFVRGETIHTEISRKFTENTATQTLVRAGFAPQSWRVSPDGNFALAVANVPP